MHYYTHHIGDYKKDTSHLTLLEHGIYRQLIDLYYLTENPLDANALRLIGCRTEEEKNLANNILVEFFQHTNEGYIQKRCEEEIIRLYSKSEKCRANAKARWAKKDAKDMQSHSERNANAMLEGMQTPCDIDANSMLPINPLTHEPINTIADINIDICPQKEILSLYRQIIPNGINHLRWDGKRAVAVRCRWREDTKRQSLDWWQGFFEFITKSDFLMGKVSSNDKKPFTISLEWIVKAENFIKIQEGRYHG